jgi:hypothetical protein
VNFDLPNRIFGTANFGRIFSAKSPREMQLGAKVQFLNPSSLHDDDIQTF